MSRHNEIDKQNLYYYTSLLEFNERILNEAMDKKNPLLERIKYLSIFQKNLDEFFKLKVKKLEKEIIYNGDKNELLKIEERFSTLISCSHNYFSKILIPELKKEKIEIIDEDKINKLEKEFLERYFKNEIYPILTPIVIDSHKSFNLIDNEPINLIFKIKKEEKYESVLIGIPKNLPRVIKLPFNFGEERYILIDNIVKMNLKFYFPQWNIENLYKFRVLKREFIKNLNNHKIIKIENEIIRIEFSNNMEDSLVNFLKFNLMSNKNHIHYFNVSSYVDFNFLNEIYEISDRQSLKYDELKPIIKDEFNKNIFKELIKKDILLHHPFDSFNCLIKFLFQAAIDEKVLAIKVTLYRVDFESEVIKALELATKNGKAVTVIVETRARFDEEKNINVAQKLSSFGCKVICNVSEVKIHCKIILVVRKDKNQYTNYINVSTGNYNIKTANSYTDLSLFSSNKCLTKDICNIFNYITTNELNGDFYKAAISPLQLRETLIKLIDDEICNVKKGKNGKIIAKMNGLSDEKLIFKLYEAASQGVKIHLIVRGGCSIVFKDHQINKNISVISIVGRFLEHSRVFYFLHDNEEKMYISSADWMKRNLDNRVEIMIPIEDYDCKNIIKNILNTYLKDDSKSYILKGNGKYLKNNTVINFSSQQYFIDNVRSSNN